MVRDSLRVIPAAQPDVTAPLTSAGLSYATSTARCFPGVQPGEDAAYGPVAHPLRDARGH